MRIRETISTYSTKHKTELVTVTTNIGARAQEKNFNACEEVDLRVKVSRSKIY